MEIAFAVMEKGEPMAEYVNEDKNEDKLIIFKNGTESDFSVGVGIVFRKSGIYEISINDKTTTVTKMAKRKTGHWIYSEDDGQDGWYCSECEGFVPWDYGYYGLDGIDFIEDYKVCPFCDAKMISHTGERREGN
jgi:hypothetical protein